MKNKIKTIECSVKPFLKWAGGKRKLLSKIQNYIPKEFSIYYEPFVGGGAVLFYLLPKKAIVSDVSEELINVYRVIKNNVNELIEDLKRHKNEKEYYYKIRALDRENTFNSLSNVRKASRIIYLNKTCYNGLFRVNKKGYFNVPFGRYINPDILNEDNLRSVSQYLNENDIDILNTDFEDVLKDVKKGDFVYLDPPYHPVSETSSFTSYTNNGFNEQEQIRLKKVCDRLNKIGCKFLLSNSDSNLVMDLYKDYRETIEKVQVPRSINCKASGRGKINEVLIRNYD